jgi:alpha-methylacyl-CoA racemase
MPGPLEGLKIVEFGGLGPAPFCAMLLADLGADVLRIDRDQPANPLDKILRRGRPILTLDLKSDSDQQVASDLVARADALIEGFRPGVMERIGLGPKPMLRANPHLVYGRMTGWGQHGPYANMAGHDINYISLTGALHAIGPLDKPAPPLNLVGDFGGGALYLAFGLMSAVLYAKRTGVGQVVDCAMTDGTASLLTLIYGLKASGNWRDTRASNLLDAGAPFYDTYQCACGGWISLGPLEPQFYAELLMRLDIKELNPAEQYDKAQWPEIRACLRAVIAEKTRDAWTAFFDGTDVCFAPVLSLDEAPLHPHNLGRGTFIEIDGVTQPAPAPRFSATPGHVREELTRMKLSTREALERWA